VVEERVRLRVWNGVSNPTPLGDVLGTGEGDRDAERFGQPGSAVPGASCGGMSIARSRASGLHKTRGLHLGQAGSLSYINKVNAEIHFISGF
jgi:hypothetical protein